MLSVLPDSKDARMISQAGGRKFLIAGGSVILIWALALICVILGADTTYVSVTAGAITIIVGAYVGGNVAVERKAMDTTRGKPE